MLRSFQTLLISTGLKMTLVINRFVTYIQTFHLINLLFPSFKNKNTHQKNEEEEESYVTCFQKNAYCHQDTASLGLALDYKCRAAEYESSTSCISFLQQAGRDSE
eukprot:m.89507 g.89507  ORF g.89507 m.89507 type:complete len:105 (+) comp14583_c0_seq1:866-1180(+)